MLEVEVKVEAAHDAVRPRLDDLGAERLGAVRQIDTYYDAPHRDFAATDEALRIRRETVQTGGESGAETARLTYKGPLVESASKTREEVETPVGAADATAAALEALGFEPAATVRKDRERYALSDCDVVLDEVDGVGEFVEVEAAPDRVDPGSSVDLKTAREGVFEILRRLGLDPADQIRTSYLGLLLETAPGDECE